MEKHFGKCALCRKEGKLTFEHIPPRSALNTAPAKLVNGAEILEKERMPWDLEGLHYSNQQRGVGKYSLCPSCNNNTGTWYGTDYGLVANGIHVALLKSMDQQYLGYTLKNIHPLRFIKQVLSMFCSINNIEDERINVIRQFVLDKDAVGLDKTKYKLCMYLTRSPIVKYNALSVAIALGKTSFEIIPLSEITAYPMGFILYFNPTETFQHQGVDITYLADYNFEDVADIHMPFCVYEMNDLFPGLYRSREEIEQCIAENQKWNEEHGNELD